MTPSLSQLRGRRPLASLGQDARDVLLARARPLRACLEDRRPAERGTRGVRASHARPGAGPLRRVPAHSRRASLASHMALEGPARRTLPPSPPRAQTRKTLLRAVFTRPARARARGLGEGPRVTGTGGARSTDQPPAPPLRHWIRVSGSAKPRGVSWYHSVEISGKMFAKSVFGLSICSWKEDTF